ncbi:unnamed protein product [Orchesella dallaii]|uniref:Uncharacterized protein n=1 Tax=Orchesella dallaii TaxID=48710 RepID=A0ABP1RHE8_9HEXA
MVLAFSSTGQSINLRNTNKHYFPKRTPVLAPEEQYFDPNIENLNEHLQPFKGCLIRIQNPQNINIPVTKVSIMLSNQYYKKPSRLPVQTAETPKSRHRDHGVHTANCTSEFIQSEISSGIINTKTCLSIKFTTFSMQSKPWNCEVNIGIFVPFKYLISHVDSWYKPQIWDRKHESFVNSSKQIIPSSIPTVNINLLHYENLANWTKDSVAGKWMEQSVFPNYLIDRFRIDNNRRSKLVMAIDIHILMLVSNCTQRNRFWNVCNVTKISAINTDFEGRTVPDEIMIHKPFVYETDIELSALSSSIFNSTNLFFPSRQQQLAISPIAQQPGDGTFQLYLEMCRSHKNFLELRGNSKMDDRFSLVLLHILESVVQNYSYKFPQTDRISCIKGKRTSTTEDLKPKIYMTVTRQHTSHNFEFALIKMVDTLNVPAFVSCGKARMSGFAFVELFNVFHSTVWGFVLLSNLVLASSSYLMSNFSPKSDSNTSRRLETFFSIVKQVIKPLLEQGDPFKSVLLAETRLRVSIGAYLLVGIVLSSAYKNTNVYNMILPRQPVPYENMSELVQDEFTIYSRGKLERKEPDPLVRKIMMHSRPKANDIRYDSTLNYVKDNSVPMVLNFQIVSEIQSFMNKIVGNSEKNQSEKEIELNNLLEANVRLIPGLDLIVQSAYEQLWPVNKPIIRNNDWKQFVIEAEHFINIQQRIALTKLIDECNNTALIVPRVEANRLARHAQNKYFGSVHVGKESYYGWDYLIHFIGHVPPFVITGMEAMRWNGVAEKLVEFAAASYKPLPFVPIDPTGATMQGNVAVIFVILMGGLVIAMLAFSIEFHRSVYKFLREVVKSIRIGLIWFFSYITTSLRRTKVEAFNVKDILGELSPE